MKNKIELTIEHKDHNIVELTNKNGDTFTYDPQNHEGFEDFLSGAKILPIDSVEDYITQGQLVKELEMKIINQKAEINGLRNIRRKLKIDNQQLLYKLTNQRPNTHL